MLRVLTGGAHILAALATCAQDHLTIAPSGFSLGGAGGGKGGFFRGGGGAAG